MIKDVCHIHVFVMERGHVLFVRYGGLCMYNEEGKQNESRPVVSRLWALSRALQGVYIMHLAEEPVCVHSDDRDAGIDYYLVPALRLRCCV